MDYDDYADMMDFLSEDVEEQFDDDDMSEYDDGVNQYDEPFDGFRDDVDADADVLRSAGWGTDEDYGYFDDFGGEG